MRAVRRENLNINSVLENSEIAPEALEYIYAKWGNENTYNVYKDSIYHCAAPFPNWYLLKLVL